jgi:hypothetical protein
MRKHGWNDIPSVMPEAAEVYDGRVSETFDFYDALN